MIAPVLFLLMIADIARGVSSSTRVSSSVNDTRVKRTIKVVFVDSVVLQADLTSISAGI